MAELVYSFKLHINADSMGKKFHPPPDFNMNGTAEFLWSDT
jgi:hypothetical protein